MLRRSFGTRSRLSAKRHPVVEVPFEGEPIKAAPVAPPKAGRGRGSGSGSGRGRGFFAAVGRHPFRLVGAIVAVLVLWFLFALFQPFHGDGSGKVEVTIPKGASVSEVGDLLGEKGVIDSSTLFQVRVTLDGKRSELYPGHFTLAHGMSYGAAIDALSKPPVKRVTSVTIPEGYSRSQAAQLVEEDGLEGDYMKETVRSKYLNPAKYGGKGAKDLEGFLFPDTFEMKPGAPVADLVQLQLQDFQRRIKGVDMSYAKSKNLTVFDVLTIASMIEREAGGPAAAQAGRLGRLQPPARRDSAGDRRDDPLRHRQLRRAADRIGAGRRLALQHAHPLRPAAGPDQQPRDRSDRSRRPSGQVRLPLLREQAEHVQRTRLLEDQRRIRKRRRQVQRGPRSQRRQRAVDLRGIGVPRLAVLGHPVAHSRSPAMQNAALAALGLAEEWSYEAIDVAPEEFEARLRAMPAEGFAGANVTVPHKLQALAVADVTSEMAREIGAANTLIFRANGIEAHNTDAGGLIASLPRPPRGRRALVLGRAARPGRRSGRWGRRGRRSRSGTAPRPGPRPSGSR